MCQTLRKANVEDRHALSGQSFRCSTKKKRANDTTKQSRLERKNWRAMADVVVQIKIKERPNPDRHQPSVCEEDRLGSSTSG